ncbi:hypothetical protein [Parasedimentitalea huanghaiensis]|uniref:hypothetical protein n=1 Tax=Parasedimentitalea huanghaiensis TaxID=2682100 RepID=UPI0014311B58|nr:hypothetical protein [Zongyanglinia huanghaiensis]
MHKWMLSLVAVGVLSACGVDGEPVQPSLNAGVSVSNSGVHTRGGVGLNKGPLGIYLGF